MRRSVVIPTLNGLRWLPELFSRLRAQDVDEPVEVVAVDSGSTDGTLEFLRANADVVCTVTPAEFNHGETRNLGVAASHGELVVLLVQDALPASVYWLRRLTEPFADPLVAGTWARQRPAPGSSALTRRALERYAGASSSPRSVRVPSPMALDAASPLEQLSLCTFDNVCSCLRREVWAHHPFQRVPIAEDLAWAREVLQYGFTLVFTPGAEVMHSHERGARYEFLRTVETHRQLRRLFRVQTVPTAAVAARAVASSLVEHLRWLRDERRTALAEELPRALALALAWPLGQYVGARAEDEGWAWPPGGGV
jgi:rhamnosyltransferase